ncbi:gliding motility-associated C-terminal domain-containing protein [Sediminibacterium roseum]|uniref:Gliding motility-associated C-terminal domain-containing protein n=1 Tax=Sediminibacterium roseum TaxID=1978412 RepID=A0ABW9ZSK0_9BACT|nr:gliding motility-associated C-terminal domain-containing protein [Sediminibacterium roseum]NCI50086.1 gliding motility-associated C-terminal domain-containing protein [Sediminibacterium roseum]
MRKSGLVIVFLLCSHLLSAQLCSGSLGDPIVNITFGSASGPLKPGVTNLAYTSTACPNDGEYTITKFTSQCFSSSWFTLQNDHTGNQNGQFMLINASVTPNDFYVDTIQGLCSNTTFEFAAWIVNMLSSSSCSNNGIKPNLTFSIETTTGTVLAKYQTGDIPSQVGQWKQYGTYFKTPAGVTAVVLRLTNNAPGGCGNDLAIDDITFRPCGPTVQLTVRNDPKTTIAFCDDNNSFSMDASTGNGFSGSTIQWQLSTDSGRTWKDIAGAQTTSYTRLATPPGYYQYRLVTAETANFPNIPCRVASNVISVLVREKPVYALRKAIGCTTKNLTIETANGVGYTFRWRGPNGFTSTVYNPVVPNVRYIDSGLYLVDVRFAECTGTDSVYVNVFPGVTASVNRDTMICEGQPLALSATGGSIYSWTPATGLTNPGINNPFASPATETVYKVYVSEPTGCRDSASVTVSVWNNPVITAGPDKTLYSGGRVVLDGRLSGNWNSFTWSPATAMTGANTLSPTVSPTDTVTYRLSALPGMGCPPVWDDVFVFVYKNLEVPNAFSPNGDGINDVWFVKGLDTYPESTVRIFNRSGATVYEAKGGAAWDGTYKGQPVPIATYYYVIDLHVGQPPVSGSIVVIR